MSLFVHPEKEEGEKKKHNTSLFFPFQKVFFLSKRQLPAHLGAQASPSEALLGWGAVCWAPPLPKPFVLGSFGGLSNRGKAQMRTGDLETHPAVSGWL